MQLATILLLQVVLLWSCQDNKKAPPFPVHENEYLQPVTNRFYFFGTGYINLDVQDPSKIKPLPTTKFDWDKLPSKPFDIGCSEKFVGLWQKRNWTGIIYQVLILI